MGIMILTESEFIKLHSLGTYATKDACTSHQKRLALQYKAMNGEGFNELRSLIRDNTYNSGNITMLAGDRNKELRKRITSLLGFKPDSKNIGMTYLRWHLMIAAQVPEKTHCTAVEDSMIANWITGRIG